MTEQALPTASNGLATDTAADHGVRSQSAMFPQRVISLGARQRVPATGVVACGSNMCSGSANRFVGWQTRVKTEPSLVES